MVGVDVSFYVQFSGEEEKWKETRDVTFYGAVILSASFALSVLPFFRKNLRRE